MVEAVGLEVLVGIRLEVVRDGKDESANQGTALWRKAKSEVTEEQLLCRSFSRAWNGFEPGMKSRAENSS
jgi:HSP90 family molecular chaperone